MCVCESDTIFSVVKDSLNNIKFSGLSYFWLQASNTLDMLVKFTLTLQYQKKSGLNE